MNMRYMAWLIMMMAVSAAGQAAEPAIDAPTLHIVATGKAVSQPDRIIVKVPIEEKAETATAARALAQAKIEKIKTALSSAGINPAVVAVRMSPAFGFLGNGQDGEVDLAGGAVLHMAAQASQRSASSLVEIRLAEAAQLSKVNKVLDDLNLPTLGGPTASLTNDSAARAIAIADAMRKARSEADVYAQAMGFAVVGITRVSNDCANDYRAIAAGWTGMFGGQQDLTVATTASACVDFMLEKRP